MCTITEKKVTAIFAMSDVMALGVYDYANDHGLEIGKDIALIGFDDRQFSTVFKPALTTRVLPPARNWKKGSGDCGGRGRRHFGFKQGIFL